MLCRYFILVLEEKKKSSTFQSAFVNKLRMAADVPFLLLYGNFIPLVQKRNRRPENPYS